MVAFARLRSTLIELRSNWRMLKHVGRFRPNKPWNAARLLDERVAAEPNGVAIKYLDLRYTWVDFDQRVNQYANFFQQRGVKRGDVVAIFMDNRPEYLFTLVALNRLGAIGSLINTNVTGIALGHVLKICKPRAVLVGSEHADTLCSVVPTVADFESVELWVELESASDNPPASLRRINDAVAQQPTTRPSAEAPPNSSDVMCYIYTSGTTGLPKAAIISNKRLLAAAYMFGHAIMEAKPGDVIYGALPLYHSSGIYAGLAAILSTGACLALRRKFSASRFWDDVHHFDASIFIYIGELCRYLLNAPAHPHERGHRIRLATGNGLRPDIWQAFQDRFQVPLMREFYGATEGNAPIVNFEGRTGMVGRIQMGQVLVACDPATGELRRNAQGFCERVPVGQKGILLGKITKLFNFDGYLDKSATNSKVVTDIFKPGDRYFNSGDLLELHADGWVSFADRIGDTFRWKGENVSTNEVAEILNGAAGVLESNVYGVTVPGSEGRAGMAALSVDGAFDLAALGCFVCEKMPAYQRPYFIRVLSEMKVTGTFKHQKVDYRDEGYDPARVSDPLYFLDGQSYVRIDAALHRRIAAGEITPGRSLGPATSGDASAGARA